MLQLRATNLQGIVRQQRSIFVADKRFWERIAIVLKEILQNDYDSLQSFENLRPESGRPRQDD